MSARAKSYSEELLELLQNNNASPDFIDEVDDNTTYIGYMDADKVCAESVSKEDELRWIVKKIVTTGTISRTYYADGDNKNFSQSLTGYASKEYTYKKY